MEGHRSGATTYPFSSLLKGLINFARQNRSTVKSDKSPNNTWSCDSVNLSLTLDSFSGSQDWQNKNSLSPGVIFTQKFCQIILFETFPGFVPCSLLGSSQTKHSITLHGKALSWYKQGRAGGGGAHAGSENLSETLVSEPDFHESCSQSLRAPFTWVSYYLTGTLN